MSLVSIAERELRVAARNPRTYRTRQWIALAVIVIGGSLLWAFDRWGGLLIGGQDLFRTLSWLAFAFCLFAGAAMTCDSISEEKREGAIGLLFLTKLSSGDIVLGKFVSHWLIAFYGLLSALPVLGIGMMAGGVEGREFGRVSVNLVNTLFFSGSVGMFVSSLSRNQRKASSASSLLVLFFAVCLPLAAEWLRQNTPFTRAAEGFFIFSPLYAQRMTQWTLPGPHQHDFWITTMVVHGLAWAALFLAAFCLKRSWREKASKSKIAGWRASRASGGRAGEAEDSRLENRRRLLGINPYGWLSARDRFSGASLWIALLVVLAGAAAMLWRYSGMVPAEIIYLLAGLALSLMTKVTMANFSALRFAEDKRSGALELLLATPLGAPDLVRGHWFAIWIRLGWPFLVGLMILCWLAAAYLSSELNPEKVADALPLIGGLLLTYVTDWIALGWVGMWMGLWCKQPRQAPASAFWRVVLLPWGLAIPCAILYEWRLRELLQGTISFTALSFGLSVSNGILFSLWARNQLRRRFRVAVSQAYQPPAGAAAA